jgi:colicin import membrane protein
MDMDELRESSLLFSLEGLMETERERVQREAREAQKRRDEELGRVAEMAERRRQAALQEREARERRERVEQERQRLEQEHLDAMKHATIERARIETEGRMRLVEAEQARKHELSLSQIREAQRTARYQGFAWLSSGALVVALVGGCAAYFGLLAPAQARAEQHLQSIIDINAQQARTAERALATERSKQQTLTERIKQLEAQVDAPPQVRPEPKAPTHAPGIRVVTPPAPPLDCPDDGDPLRPCLRRGPRR